MTPELFYISELFVKTPNSSFPQDIKDDDEDENEKEQKPVKPEAHVAGLPSRDEMERLAK